MRSQRSQVPQHMTACVTCVRACDLVVYHCPVVMAKGQPGDLSNAGSRVAGRAGVTVMVVHGRVAAG